MFHSIRISRIHWKRKIDVSLGFFTSPRKGGEFPSLSGAPTSLGHAWTPALYISQPALPFIWVCMTSSSGITVNSDDKSPPAGAVRSQGEWPVHTVSYPASVTGKTRLGTFSLLKYSWLLMLISAIQQSDSDIYIYISFFIFFSMVVYHRILNIFPCALW